MNSKSQRSLPPVFSSEQEQNKAECAAIWYTYAGEAEQQGDLLGARMGFMCAWKEQPEELRYFQTLVNFLDRSGFVDELFKVYGIGVQLHRNHLPTLVNYSNLLNLYGVYDTALEVAENSLMLDSHCLAAWGNMGNAFRGLGEYSRAASCYEKILKHEPDNPQAAFNLASVCLSVGDFAKGFYYYDFRLNLPGYERLQCRNNAEMWTREDLDDKTILIYAEQGLGDTLMCSRYLNTLLDLGARKVYFEVQRPLTWLLKVMENDRIEIIERKNLDEPLTLETDFQFPLLSLPQIALLSKSTLVTEVPYLKMPELKAPRANEKLRGIQERKKFRVGLCWQGNPHAAVDCGRSLALEMLQPLFELSDIDFVSLQSRDGIEMVPEIAAEFSNFFYLPKLDADTRSFEETLMLMSGLDLIVSTDTAIMHLAGALGIPCWGLLQKFPEWRWGLFGEESFWYPKMRIFRQQQAGDWDSVIEDVVNLLRIQEN